MKDSLLLKKIVATNRSLLALTGGTSKKDTDDLAAFFGQRNIPLAINHCALPNPAEEHEHELKQVEYLTARYQGHVTSVRRDSGAGV